MNLIRVGLEIVKPFDRLLGPPERIVCGSERAVFPCVAPRAPTGLAERVLAIGSTGEFWRETVDVFPPTVGDATTHARTLVEAVGIHEDRVIGGRIPAQRAEECAPLHGSGDGFAAG